MKTVSALSIPADHPSFAGHFPGNPIVPGVVLLDEALQAIGEAVGMDLSACRINAVKFLSPVKPGEAVMVEHEAGAEGMIRFDIIAADRKIATGTLRVGPAGMDQ